MQNIVTKMKRRNFTQHCLAATTGLVFYAGNKTRGLPISSIPKTDTHVHLIDLNQFSYSWLNNAPEINRSFSVVDFQEASQHSNISKIIFMESGADAGLGVKEAHWVSSLVKQEPRIKGIIARLDLSKGVETEVELDQLMQVEILKGIRVPFPKNAMQSNAFLNGMRLLAKQGLTFDLLLSTSLLEPAAMLAKKCPNNIFILDHIGNPDIKNKLKKPWETGIEKLAQMPNVHCKISGVITRIGKSWTLEKIKPYILYIIEQFGVDRLVYGGDWPVVLQAGSYRTWSRAFEEITRELSANELHKIYHQNADRIYGV